MVTRIVSYEYRLLASGPDWERVHEELVHSVPDGDDEAAQLAWIAARLPIVERLGELVEVRELRFFT